MSIQSDLVALGLRPSDRVLVHTAFRQVGPSASGPEAFLAALIESVGTLLVPTLTGSAEEVSSGKIEWSWDREPEPWMGVVPRVAVRRYVERGDGWRSLHPTHSVVAFGPEAEAATRGHLIANTPCGPGSPYHWLSENGGKILLAGCGHASNTSLHMAEELAGVDYHLQKERSTGLLRLKEGQEVSFDGVLHAWGRARAFEKADAVPHRFGLVGRAPSRLIDAAELRDWAVANLVRNPEFLLR